MSSTLTGQQSVPSGTPVAPGPITSGQQLRLGESCANTFDPRVSGLVRPVGSLLFTRDGTICYQKTGTGNTAWSLAAGGSLPSTMVLADGTTVTAPDAIVEQHTTTGTPGAGFGLTALAVELHNAANVLKRAFSAAVTWSTATAGSEVAKLVLNLQNAGTLTDVAEFFWANPTLAALNLGGFGQIIRASSSVIQILVSSATGLSLASGSVSTVSADLICDQKVTVTGKVTSSDSYKQGTNLTDANLTKDGVSGSEYTLPASTLTANRVLTLAVTGATTGQIIRVTRLDNTINLYTVKDDAATTLLAMTSKQGADFKFNGTHYTLDRYWNLN